MAYTIGIDIGGTTIKAGIFDESSNLVGFSRVNTYDHVNSRKEILEHIAVVIKAMQREYEAEVLGPLIGIGVGVPGFVNRYTGEVYSSANLDLKGANIKEWIEDRIGLLCCIQGDAKLGAIAEHAWGAGREFQSLLYVTLGTGVGGGIIINDRLYEGDHFLAGEIGHTIVAINGRTCGCGKTGCLETLVSGPSIVQAYRNGVPSASRVSSAAEIAQRARSGDAHALAVYREAASTLALVLANYSAALDPALIVVGGGVSLAGSILFDPLREAYSRYTFRGENAAKIVPAILGDKAGIVGAHLLVKAAL